MNERQWIEQLVDEIGDRIAASLQCPRTDVQRVGTPTVRRFSITQSYRTNSASHTAPTNLIAKTRRFSSQSPFAEAIHETRTQDLADKEYRAHSEAFRIFDGCDSMSVPVLLECYDDLATIVMEKVRGEPLASFVSNSRGAGSRQDLSARFKQAGEWLRRYHQSVADRQTRAWNREAVQADLSEHLEKLRQDGVDKGCYDQLADQIERRLSELDDGASQIIGTIHGDFKPAHVILAEHRVTVIDFGTTRNEYGAADAGNFLADLACNAYGPHLTSRSRLRRLASEFSAGYVGRGDGDGVVRMYCVMNLLRLWRKRRQRFPNGTPLRRLDATIDRLGARSLLNRTYVDRWFGGTITEILNTTT